jgi:hypothetical protein
MEENSREANRSSTRRGIPHIAEPAVHDITPLVPLLIPVLAFSSYYLRSFLILPSHICPHIPSNVYPLDFPTTIIHIPCKK